MLGANYQYLILLHEPPGHSIRSNLFPVNREILKTSGDGHVADAARVLLLRLRETNYNCDDCV